MFSNWLLNLEIIAGRGFTMQSLYIVCEAFKLINNLLGLIFIENYPKVIIGLCPDLCVYFLLQYQHNLHIFMLFLTYFSYLK